VLRQRANGVELENGGCRTRSLKEGERPGKDQRATVNKRCSRMPERRPQNPGKRFPRIERETPNP
jgi:hypothetical protein